MLISILQLNINSDNYWEKLIPFLKSRDFDVIQLQEVTGKDTVTGNINSRLDSYAELNKILGGRYNSELAMAEKFSSSPASYIGNATFYRKKFKLLGKNIIFLNQHTGAFPSSVVTFEDETRAVLHLRLEIDGREVSFLNTHLAWAKTSFEHPHQTQQGEVFLSYLKTVVSPFVLTGDFNLAPDQPLIQKISGLARNLTVEYDVKNTLSPVNHRAQHLFPQGAAVDYICVSRDLKAVDFRVLNDDVSDHLGLSVKINI